MHQTPSETCQACADKLKQCHHSLTLWFEILSDNFKDCHIAVGFRGEADQNEAYANHLSHAKWGESKHNRMNGSNPESWAIDIFQLGADGKAHFDPPYFKKIWDFIDHIQTQAGDFEIMWGGNFSNLKDLDHLELLKATFSQSIEVISHDHC